MYHAHQLLPCNNRDTAANLKLWSNEDTLDECASDSDSSATESTGAVSRSATAAINIPSSHNVSDEVDPAHPPFHLSSAIHNNTFSPLGPTGRPNRPTKSMLGLVPTRPVHSQNEQGASEEGLARSPVLGDQHHDFAPEPDPPVASDVAGQEAPALQEPLIFIICMDRVGISPILPSHTLSFQQSTQQLQITLMAPTASTTTVPSTASSSVPAASTANTSSKTRTSKPRDTIGSLKAQNIEMAKQLDQLRASFTEKEQDVRQLTKYKVAYVRMNRTTDSAAIPKPSGERGMGKNKGQWKLQDAMGLHDDKDEYNRIMRGVRGLIDEAGLEFALSLKQQNHGRLHSVYTEAKIRYPFLKRFVGDWPAEEFVKQNLRDRRKYRNRIASGKIKSQAKSKPDTSRSASAEDDELSDLEPMEPEANAVDDQEA